MLIDDLVENALSKASERKIIDVRAGLSYTCVLLEDNSCGLAYTFRNELGCYCGILDQAGTLIGRKCAELIPWAKSNNLLMAAIGLAAVNAVLNSSKVNWNIGNVTTALEVGPSDTFGMVGGFWPILKEIKDKTENIFVFEQDVAKDSGFYSEEEIPQYLPKCDVVVITATSIINHTIDRVLANCESSREVCLVGPSTPLCPEVSKNYNVTLLAGDVVINPEQTLQIVSQGGGTMAMKHTINHVLVRV